MTAGTTSSAQRRQLFRKAIATFSLAGAVACGSTATSPTDAAGNVTALTISGAPAGNATFQLTATARMTNGAARDVTSSAQWETSSRSIAMISSTGLVTVIAAGDVEFRATYLGVAGALRLTVGPPAHETFLVSGVVHEVVPNERSLAGARVDIISGPDAGRFAISNASGYYELAGVAAGTITMVTTLEGFEPFRVGLNVAGNVQEDGWLAPMPPTNSSGDTATARCKDGSWSWSQTQAAACADNGGIAYAVCPGPFCRDLTASRRTR
jgi:hypothetical protein